MPDTPVTGIPAILNDIRVAFIFEADYAGMENDSILILPAMEGTQGNVVKNFERSAILRSDRQGGSQIGGTTAAEATLVIPVVEEPSVKFLLTSLFRGNWSTPGSTGDPFATPAGTLKPGTTRKPFRLEIKYTAYDGAGSPVPIYEIFTGCEANRMTLNIPTTGGASMTIDVMGTAATVGSSPISATAGHYRALAGAVQMASSISGCRFGYKLISDAPATDLTLLGAEQLSFTIDNNAEIKYRVGSATADHITQGDFDASLSAQLYYRNDDLVAFFVAEERKWYQLTTKAGGDSTVWDWHLPNGVINAYTHGTSGPDVTENIEVFGEYSSDADALCKFMIIETP